MVACDVEECKETAKYGVKQFTISRCKEHKEEGMVTSSKQYCEHNKRKSRCKICEDGGSEYCEHGDYHYRCKECKGPSICEHNKRRYTCVECKGTGICEHNRRRSECRICKGTGICEHDKNRSHCKICKGSSICEHNREKYYCRQCKGPGICEHNRRRNECRICKGSGICEHDRRRSHCKICKGSRICEHSREKHRCFQCSPESNHFCVRRYENGTRCIKKKYAKYDNYCTTCFVELFPNDSRSKTANLASKELKVLTYLTTEFPGVFTHDKKLFISDRDTLCTPHNRRIDFQTEVGSYVFCIEVDEHQHKYYDPLDEEERIMQIYENANKKMVFIRFNPDNYKENKILKKTPLKERLISLGAKIKEVITRIENGEGYDNWYTEIKMFSDDYISPNHKLVKRKQKKEKKQKIINRCTGMTGKNEPCKNKIKNENKFCRHHLHQEKILP